MRVFSFDDDDDDDDDDDGDGDLGNDSRDIPTSMDE
jgi:hypothetical protein